MVSFSTFTHAIFIKEASREEAVDFLLYTDNVKDHPHNGPLSWARTRTRYHVDTTVSIAVIHSKYHYR